MGEEEDKHHVYSCGNWFQVVTSTAKLVKVLLLHITEPLIVPYHINFYDTAVRGKCVIIKLFKNFPAKYLKRTDILSMTINFFLPTVLRGTQQSIGR